ncbi:Cytochrome b5 heme-binding domain-containing protein [Balamuthia mandrillaris]
MGQTLGIALPSFGEDVAERKGVAASSTKQRERAGPPEREKLLRLEAPLGPVEYLHYPLDYRPLQPPPKVGAPSDPPFCLLHALPEEIAVHVLSFVDEETLTQKVQFLSRSMRRLCQSAALWRCLLRRDLPEGFSRSFTAAGAAAKCPNNDSGDVKFCFAPTPTGGGQSGGWSSPASSAKLLYFNAVAQLYLQCCVPYRGYTSAQDCRILIHGKVYQISNFLTKHPGGATVLLRFAGTDASKYFDEMSHSSYAMRMMTDYLMGEAEDHERHRCLSTSMRCFLLSSLCPQHIPASECYRDDMS